MKKIFLKFMVMFGVALSIGLVSGTAQAIQVYVNQPGYYHGDYNYGYHRGSHCRWVGGGWYRGYWHQPRYVCYGSGGCRWVGGYCRHGYCYPARRVCW